MYALLQSVHIAIALIKSFLHFAFIQIKLAFLIFDFDIVLVICKFDVCLLLRYYELYLLFSYYYTFQSILHELLFACMPTTSVQHTGTSNFIVACS